jgi:GDP-L-fucose synthase
MHSDDAADACVFLMERIDARDIGEVINVGIGSDITIRELAELIAQITGFGGRIEFDPTRPDGTPLKCMDVSRLSALGWKPRIRLRAGIESTYRGFLESQSAGAGKAEACPATKA